jgi:hypothetical protein
MGRAYSMNGEEEEAQLHEWVSEYYKIMENMKIILPMELKVPMCGRSFESTLFLASHDVDVIRPELCCLECIIKLN